RNLSPKLSLHGYYQNQRLLRLARPHAFVMNHFVPGLEWSRFGRALRIAVAKRQDREDRPSGRHAQHLANLVCIEISNPARAESQSPSSYRHVLHRLGAIDVGPASIRRILEYHDR